MNTNAPQGRSSAFRLLRSLARAEATQEQCEFCSAPLPGEHRHLLEVATRRIICACDPCALRFENVIGRWKLIPRDARVLTNFQMPDELWQALALPINLAFLFYSTPAGKMLAMYPSPAGAIESLLPLENWNMLVAANPALERLEPDVQALLVNRLDTAREHFLAPIDRCYEVVGLIRLHWRGLSGGEKVREQLGDFFMRLRGPEPYGTLETEAAHA